MNSSINKIMVLFKTRATCHEANEFMGSKVNDSLFENNKCTLITCVGVGAEHRAERDEISVAEKTERDKRSF